MLCCMVHSSCSTRDTLHAKWGTFATCRHYPPTLFQIVHCVMRVAKDVMVEVGGTFDATDTLIGGGLLSRVPTKINAVCYCHGHVKAFICSTHMLRCCAHSVGICRSHCSQGTTVK